MRLPIACIAFALSVTPALAKSGVPENPDVSQCDNCEVFPKAFLEVDESALLDLASMPPDGGETFNILKWQLLYRRREGM